MKPFPLSRPLLALLPAAVFAFTGCSSAPKPPPPVGASRITFTEGVPGGTIVQTFRSTVTVAAIDPAKREAKLLAADGKHFTVKAGPDAINFDQVRVGDRVIVTVAETVVAYLDDSATAPGEGGAAVVALAPKGAKPSGTVAASRQITAKIVAIDQVHRTTTLQFANGATRTIPAREDVDLKQRKVGEIAVFRVTEMVALSIEKAP